jgi:hypothetical protein
VLNQVDLHVPAVISSFALGNELYQAIKAGQDVRVDFSTFGHLQDRLLPQVLAETKGGDKHNVLVVGAHLDSVTSGPGINDDGSGTALLLAQAQAMAKHQNAKNVRQKIRFAWWGAGGERARRLDLLRAQPVRRRGQEDRRHGRLRHARVAELRPVPL